MWSKKTRNVNKYIDTYMELKSETYIYMELKPMNGKSAQISFSLCLLQSTPFFTYPSTAFGKTLDLALNSCVRFLQQSVKVVSLLPSTKRFLLPNFVLENIFIVFQNKMQDETNVESSSNKDRNQLDFLRPLLLYGRLTGVCFISLKTNMKKM